MAMLVTVKVEESPQVMILEQLIYLSEKLVCVLKASSEDCLYDGLEVLLMLTFFQPLNLHSYLERIHALYSDHE